MGAIGYLYRRIFINRARMALRRPFTYVWGLIVLFYLFALPMSLRMTAQMLKADSPEGMAAVLTVIALWMIPANLIAYAKRKGLLYRNCDVHFLFPAPISPKKVLLYAHFRTLAAQFLLNVFAAVCGRMLFRVDLPRLAAWLVFAVFVENLLEAGIMMLIYGSGRLGERQRGMMVKVMYVLAFIPVLMGAYTYFREGMSFETLGRFLHGDMIQTVPVTGWYIAVVHLLFTGPDAVNVTGSVCYVLMLAAVSVAACRMPCRGEFYEDAVKFAEDYEEVVESRRQGIAQKRLGKRRKFGKARIGRWGTGAGAIFSRQLLEYKKNRYFIFDINTFMAAVGGIGVAWLYAREGGFGGLGAFEPFVIPAISAYLIFVFTALNGKWAKEIRSPYTYLIPDTPFRKLMNATGMQHVQNLVNACLLTLPGAVVMGMSPAIAALGILFYVILSANKLYALAVAEAAVGSSLGTMGKQVIQMLIQGFAIMAAVTGAAIGTAAGGELAGYVLMDVLLALFTLIFMVIATLNFYNMEKA